MRPSVISICTEMEELVLKITLESYETHLCLDVLKEIFEY